MCSHARSRADWANCRNIRCGRTPHTAVGVATNPQTRDTPRNRSRLVEPLDRRNSSCLPSRYVSVSGTAKAPELLGLQTSMVRIALVKRRLSVRLVAARGNASAQPKKWRR